MAPQDAPIGSRIGNYELLDRIGEGGMGTVYAAVHVGLGKRVAIKTLRNALAADTDVVTRFVREGKAAVAVRHPNVVDVDDVGVHEGVPYLVMELLEGESLQALLTRRGRLSPQETADIVVPVLSAMAESHRAGVVHRDLKPDNIFLARGAGGLPVPKVLDFGISKLLEAQTFRLTGERAMLGTPYYMAPEQASSARDVDARSDLYAIGVILYHALSGRVPFTGASLAQVLSQIMHAQPVPLREHVPGVPPALEELVLRALAKDPAARYQDARSLSRALLPFASERIALTYRAELAGTAADSFEPVYGGTVAVNTTLRSAVRSVATQKSDHSLKLVWGLSGVALALVGALLAFWPKSDAPTQTTVSPAVQVPEAVPPTPVIQASPPESPPEQPAPNAAPDALSDKRPQPTAADGDSAASDGKARVKPRNRPRPPTEPTAPAAPEKPHPASDEDIWGNRK